ncbi:MAG: sodium-dependent transporter [Cyclobacteriaceae bacterium]
MKMWFDEDFSFCTKIQNLSEHKAQYSSRLGAILTMVGVAVGLGNVWRFPYMMGSYGGSAFLLIYFAFTILFAFPALITEMSLGKANGEGTISSYASIFKGSIGKGLGILLVLVVTIAGSYYAVVVANVWYSTFFSIVEGFSPETTSQYQDTLGNGILQYLCTVLLVIVALLVVFLGLKKGIERISMFIMPFFVLAILYMIIHAWMMPGAIQKAQEFLSPDFASVGSTEIFAALGQAFFSVGLGGTFVVVYSGYISESSQIPKIAMLTCLGDLGSSVLVSLFLVPAILVLGLEMNAGPSLIFNTLPELFSTLPGGRLIGSLFLIALSLVAFLSLIAAFQVPLSSLKIKSFSKKKLIIAFGVLQIVLTLPSALYPEIIGTLDLVFGSGMQVFGSMMAIVGVWWGVKNKKFIGLLFTNPNGKFARFSKFWLRWAIPGTLLTVLIGYLYDNFL